MTEPTPTPMPDRARAIRQRARIGVKALPEFGHYAEARAAIEGLADLVVDLADEAGRLRRALEGRTHV